jgi:hypothetical protein
MIHYSCDRCRRTIDTNDELRFIVRIEVEAVMAPLDEELTDEDRDYLMEISESLENGTMEEPLYADEMHQRKQFDLCTDCHRKFRASPLGTDASKQLNFSEN